MFGRERSLKERKKNGGNDKGRYIGGKRRMGEEGKECQGVMVMGVGVGGEGSRVKSEARKGGDREI